MAHRVWRIWVNAYTEGRLSRPFSTWVERHARRCPACRGELRTQLSFMRHMDDLLFTHTEAARTAALAVEMELASPNGRRQAYPKYAMLLSGAAACAVIVLMLSLGFGAWFGSGVTVVAASGWSTGVATTIPIEGDLGEIDAVLLNPSAVGVGSGVSVPVTASEEWSG